MMIEKGFGLAIGIASLVFLGSAAIAQQPAPPPAQEGAQGGGARLGFAACKSDLQTLCRDASGLAARIQCLKTNQDKLSPDCIGAIRAILGVVQAKAAAVENAPRPLQACQQDLATLCPDLTAGERGRMRCLRDNSAKLSPGCTSALKVARTQSQNALLACEADRTRLCGGAGNKPADQLKCLKEKASELGAECRKLVEIVRPAKKAAAKAEAKTAPAPTAASVPPASPPSSPPPPAAIAPKN